MINFQYARANDVADAVRQITADPTAKFIAGGTNLIDLMKDDVERPSRLIDISRLPLKTVETTATGGLRIGALVPNSDLAYHPLIGQRYPMLGSAILAGGKLSSWDVQNDSGEPAPLDTQVASGASDPMAISVVPLERQFIDFANAIQKGGRPLVTGEEGLAALEIVEAVYDSCRSGKKIMLRN